MIEKMYIVVKLAKDEEINDCRFDHFPDYSSAFDAFNEAIATQGQQLFKQPKFERPLRAVLENENVELWIVNRTNELIK